MTHPRHTRLVPILALTLLGCHDVDARSSSAAAADLPEPYDHHYGIYLNGIKVGWMRNRLQVDDRVALFTDLEARVGGMGRVSKVTLEEMRAYDARSGKLSELRFAQGAATGTVRVNGKAAGNGLALEIEAGKVKQAMQVAVTETLEDAMVVDRLARSARVGAKATSTRFDASVQKNLEAKHEILAVEKKMFGGVPVKTVKMQTEYTELGVTEVSWLDDTGKVLESRVGGFFVARLEPPSEAKRLDFQQDLLVSAVVSTPQPVQQPEKLAGMKLRFRGFGDAPPPSSDRQQVSRDGEIVTLELSRDAVPPEATFPLPPVQAADQEFVKATPFIQSDHQAVRQAARRAVGDARELPTALSRLSGYVYRHVRDEYVPAYSNALEALTSGRGDCTEHSVLFVALARSLGIPARVAVGIAYWPPGNGFGWHAWAEVKAEGKWIAVDPTWNQPIADATHIKLAGGGPAEQARIVMLLGRLELVGMELR